MRIKLATAFVACLAGCASGQTRSPIDLRTVVSDPAEYAGERIAVHACINVIVHGVALLPCGERRPNVDIKASDTGDGHYADLVSYAHQNMGASPEELPVVVVGVFRDSATAQEPLHSITVEQFIPQVSP